QRRPEREERGAAPDLGPVSRGRNSRAAAAARRDAARCGRPLDGAYLIAKPLRGSKSLPSPRVALIHDAAGRPSRIGWPVIVISVPGMKSLLRMPARVSVLGPSASKPQVVTVPSLFFTSTSSHECRFVY